MKAGIFRGTFWAGGAAERVRACKTLLIGEKNVVVRDGSRARDPSVLEDQRLRNRCVHSSSSSSQKGKLGKENGEADLFEEEVEDANEELESMEERGASESVLERGRITSPYMTETGVSGNADWKG